MNPSTADLLEAVEATRADAVVILPNNRNIVPVARQVSSLTNRPVDVVATGSVVEALSALVGYAPDAPLADNVASMADAAARVHAGEVTQAVRESTADGRSIAAGDWIAISGDGIVAAKATAGDAVVALVDALVGDDTELVTVVVGEGAEQDDTTRLVQHLAETRPEVEVELHQGDQPLYPYLVGAE
jgi:dihydroxyacetone kinase-like predicted kinase